MLVTSIFCFSCNVFKTLLQQGHQIKEGYLHYCDYVTLHSNTVCHLADKMFSVNIHFVFHCFHKVLVLELLTNGIAIYPPVNCMKVSKWLQLYKILIFPFRANYLAFINLMTSNFSKFINELPKFTSSVFSFFKRSPLKYKI